MKENKLLKHFIVIGFGSFLNLFLGLLTTPIITRIVNPNEYGQLSIFTMYSSIAVMTICLGLDQALVRFFYDQNSLESKRGLLAKCIFFPIILSIFIVLFIIFSLKLNLIEYEFSNTIMIILCIYSFSELLLRFSKLLLRVDYKSKMFSTLNIISKLLYIVIAIPLLLIYKNNHLLILTLATTISSIVCLIVSIIYQKELWDILKCNVKNCKTTTKELLKYSYPFIFSMSITMIFQSIDTIALNYYSTYSEIGIYSSAMSLVHIFSIIQTTFNTLWMPAAIEHYTKDRNDKSFFVKGNQIITFIMFFIGASLILVKDVFSLLLGEKYRAAAYVIPFLTFSPIMYTISETTVGGLNFMKKSKMHVLIAIGSCLTNIIGNFLLVPKFGCIGAAIATGISYIVFFSLRTFMSNKYYYINFHLKKFYILTLVFSIYALYNTINSFNIFILIFYILIIILMIFLYKDVIISGFEAVKELITKKRKKVKI